VSCDNISGTGLITTPVTIGFGSNNNLFIHTLNLDSKIVRVGLNYKFGGPVVAKY
jgi:outer membrane immunogenic protein